MPTKHPTPPTPDQGAIAFFTARPTAVSQVRLLADPSAPAGVSLVDLDQACAVDGWDTLADLQDRLGPVVYPDLGAYKRSSAWRLAQVLEALGVDASELEDLGQLEDLEEDEPEPAPIEDAYDFTAYPPGHRPAVLAAGQEVFETVRDAVSGIIRRAADASGEHVEISPETEHAIIEVGQRAVEARWPGAFRVGCEFKHGVMGITLRVHVNAAEHAAAWAKYMDDTVPRGYVAEGIGGKVEWSCRERPEEGRTVSFYLDAIAECWRAYLHRDADVLADLLALAGVWDGMRPTEGVQAGRIRWVSSWTLLERGLAMRWAAATRLHASDNDDVAVPTRPACIDQGRPA